MDEPAAPPQSPRIDAVRELIDQRRLRHRFLPSELFHEPAWDMLLVLYVCWHENRVINVKALVGLVGAPVTTGQRWIDHMSKLGLVIRTADMIDRRRIEVSISDTGRRLLEQYLGEIG
ncbi:MarR family winged helix-turn-helix transcriptional regulator [Sphingomonas sp. CFBP 8760]|uniref:MarR family winged helix-turn-helix transcriptional regulator n=1 Tax=Sphingomonas sp. CFBP 8760 TaxID=2775282 RepID=UPI001FCED7FB|nr:MarR family winged helix-turn-helix transcriptional regulator [Sphingomonas sp. CFBP 8760]